MADVIEAREPAQLAAQALEACLALATGSLATAEFDAHRTAAYERACALAEAALGHAMAFAGAQQPAGQLQAALGELVAVTGLLADRVVSGEGTDA